MVRALAARCRTGFPDRRCGWWLRSSRRFICLAAVARGGRRTTARPGEAPALVAGRAILWNGLATLVVAALTILVASHPFAPELVRGKLEVSVLDVARAIRFSRRFPMAARC